MATKASKAVVLHQLESMLGLKKPIPRRVFIKLLHDGSIMGHYWNEEAFVPGNGEICIAAIFELKTIKRYQRVIKEVKG